MLMCRFFVTKEASVSPRNIVGFINYLRKNNTSVTFFNSVGSCIKFIKDAPKKSDTLDMSKVVLAIMDIKGRDFDIRPSGGKIVVKSDDIHHARIYTIIKGDELFRKKEEDSQEAPELASDDGPVTVENLY